MTSLKHARLTANVCRNLNFIEFLRKPKKIYSKIAYGKLNFLQGQLLYGYTEETIATLKNEMQNKL